MDACFFLSSYDYNLYRNAMTAKNVIIVMQYDVMRRKENL